MEPIIASCPTAQVHRPVFNPERFVYCLSTIEDVHEFLVHALRDDVTPYQRSARAGINALEQTPGQAYIQLGVPIDGNGPHVLALYVACGPYPFRVSLDRQKPGDAIPLRNDRWAIATFVHTGPHERSDVPSTGFGYAVESVIAEIPDFPTADRLMAKDHDTWVSLDTSSMSDVTKACVARCQRYLSSEIRRWVTSLYL